MTDNVSQAESDKPTEITAPLSWPCGTHRMHYYRLIQGAVGNLIITSRSVSGEAYARSTPDVALKEIREVAKGLGLLADDMEREFRRPH